jgi:cytochrome P450
VYPGFTPRVESETPRALNIEISHHQKILKIIPMYIALFYELTKFNLQFINETVRLANIVPGIFRKALRDIQFKGMNSRYTVLVSLV